MLTQTELYAILKSNGVTIECQLKTRRLRKIHRPFIAVSKDVYRFLAPVPDALCVYMAFCAHTIDGYVTTPVTHLIEFCGLPRKRFYTALKFLRVVGLVLPAEEYLSQTGRPAPKPLSKRNWVVLDLTENELKNVLQSIAIKKHSETKNGMLFPEAPVSFQAKSMPEKLTIVSPTVSPMKQTVFHRRNKNCFDGETVLGQKSSVQPEKSSLFTYTIHKQIKHKRLARTNRVRKIADVLSEIPLTSTSASIQSSLTPSG